MGLSILADENIPFLHEYFSQWGEITTKAGRSITSADLQKTDILLVRSVTQVNQQLLQNTSVKAVATATIGFDHIDRDWLERQNIFFCRAPGCNALGVVDYVTATLAHLSLSQHYRLDKITVGIVGLGNVGSRLYKRLSNMGIKCVGYDPFVNSSDYQQMSFNELLACDVISLHVPLTTEGAQPTKHLFNELTLSKLKPNACLINTSRGAVIDNQALSEILQKNTLLAVLDVWENEPDINLTLLKQVLLATPHIAGYSLEGKWRGTKMVAQQLAAQFNLPFAEDIKLPNAVWPELKTNELLQSIMSFYPIDKESTDSKNTLLQANNSAEVFDALRKNYPPRREITSYLKVMPESFNGDNLLQHLQLTDT